jgi:hypothetical protein
MLKEELGFGPDHPLFPATRMGHGADRAFEAQGLSHQHWTTAEPIRIVFRAAFAAAGLPYANPHSFRNTLVLRGQRICRTPQQPLSATVMYLCVGKWKLCGSLVSLRPHGYPMRKSQ